MKAIETMKTLSGERSKLVNLTKAQIVEAIIEVAPRHNLLKVCKIRRFLREELIKDEVKRFSELLRCNKEELVRISYEIHDLILASRYTNTSRIFRPKSAVSKEDQKIEVDKRSYSRMLYRGKKEKVIISSPKSIKVVKRQPLTKKQAKARTLSYLESIRAHNRFLSSGVEITKD